MQTFKKRLFHPEEEMTLGNRDQGLVLEILWDVMPVTTHHTLGFCNMNATITH